MQKSQYHAPLGTRAILKGRQHLAGPTVGRRNSRIAILVDRGFTGVTDKDEVRVAVLGCNTEHG